MPHSKESDIFSLSAETNQGAVSIGWLGRLQQYEEDAHVKFRSLYEKIALGEKFPRGFTKQTSKFSDNPWVWTSLSFSPSKEELDEVPKPLRMLLNDLGIKASDGVGVEISFRTKKLEDGKPGEYDGNLSLKIKPQEITRDRMGATMDTLGAFYVDALLDFQNRPIEAGQRISDCYNERNPKVKKLVSKPIHAEILKGAAEWIGNLLDQNQNKKLEGSDVDYGWIEAFEKNGRNEADELRKSVSALFNLTDEVVPSKWGATPAERKSSGTLLIDVQPEDYSSLPEDVNMLLVDLGIDISTPFEIIIAGNNTLQLLPKAVSRDTLGIAFAMNYDVDHKVIAPQVLRHGENRGFSGDYFRRGEEVQQGYAEMPRFLKSKILNEILKWGQEMLKSRKTSD